MNNAIALFAIATLIWGSTWLAITFQLGVVEPEVSVVYRFALAAVIFFAWCAAGGQRSVPAANACVVGAARFDAVRA